MSPAPTFVLAAALFATQAAALQPLITDDTGTQGHGGNQLEVSLNQSRTSLSGARDRAGGLAVGYTRGVTETIDIYATASYLRLRPDEGNAASGPGSPSIGSKWRFLDTTTSGTSAASKIEFLLPVSDGAEQDGLGSASLGGQLTFILTQEVPFGEVHVNASAGRLRYRAAGANQGSTPIRLTAAPVWHVSENWKLALDVGAQWEKAEGQTLRTSYAELGAIWSAGEDVDLAVGLIRTANNQNPQTSTVAVTAGLTWRFK